MREKAVEQKRKWKTYTTRRPDRHQQAPNVKSALTPLMLSDSGQLGGTCSCFCDSFLPNILSRVRSRSLSRSAVSPRGDTTTLVPEIWEVAPAAEENEGGHDTMRDCEPMAFRAINGLTANVPEAVEAPPAPATTTFCCRLLLSPLAPCAATRAESRLDERPESTYMPGIDDEGTEKLKRSSLSAEEATLSARPAAGDTTAPAPTPAHDEPEYLPAGFCDPICPGSPGKRKLSVAPTCMELDSLVGIEGLMTLRPDRGEGMGVGCTCADFIDMD